MKLSKILSALILSSGISYGMGIADVKELVLANSFIIKQNQDAIEIEKQNEELSKTLYQPIISTSYNYSRSDTSSFFSTKESSSFNIALKYNLFNGFSDKYNIESSELRTKAQKYKTEATIKDIELQASLEYIDILKAKERVKVENKNVTLLLSRLDKTKQFYKNGLLSKDELLKLEVELQNAILQRS
ncbi:MAG: TolC family protein, partial [Campylobacterales bacterium]|nr:TolC family protein [Campylobacterales bacterium]